VINAPQSLATGSYAFVGFAEAEMKATDAGTGQLLAGANDKRGAALLSVRRHQLGDAQNAMNYWSQRIATRLLELQGRSTAAH
jgi:hypothetical protein